MSLNLLQLLNTLNSAEKRYCTLYLRTFSNKKEDNKNLSDFKKLQRIAKSNKVWKGNITEGNSTRLYYKILDALFLFHQETILPDEKQLIRRARVLYAKGFYKEAFKITDKILKQNLHENHLLKIEVLELRVLNAIKKSDVQYLNSDFNTDKKLLDELSTEYFNLVDYEALWASFKLESTTAYFYASDHSNKSNLLKNETKALSPAAKVIFNKIKGFVSMKEGNYPEATFYANRSKHLYEQNPYLIKKDPSDYIRSIRNICISLIFNNMFDAAEKILHEVDNKGFDFYNNTNVDIVTEYFILQTLVRMDIVISMGNMVNFAADLPKHESKYNSLKDILPLNEKVNANISFSLINLYGGNYRKALKQINFALKESEKFRKDVFHLALISELTVHYLLGNITLLESKLISFKRYLNEPELPFGFEKELPALLGKIIQFPETRSNFTQLHNAITKSLEEENRSVYKNFIPLYLIAYRK